MIDPQFETYMNITIIIGLIIFFIPSIIAFCRKVKSKWLIFFLSLFFVSTIFFGWINDAFDFFLFFARPIFWLVALIWACAGKKEEKI